ncbi:hypothetical protein JCM10207_001561 [Rhodosporidiobolus poonsookiae]
MVDIRLRWQRKFSYMSPADFQAAQLQGKRNAAEGTGVAQGRERDGETDEERPRKRQRRQRYGPSDFQTPFASPAEVEAWFAKFSCLGKRNFYVVQNHWATRDHFDLRMQLDGTTTSWAIPNTLAKPAERTSRLAVETVPHSIAYTLLEGSVASGKSTTGVWDLGTYTIHQTKYSEGKKQKLRDEGLDDAETTDDDDDSVQSEDERQEDLFRDALYRSSFLPTPATVNRAGLPQTKDSGHKRGFVVELNGQRYRRLRLTFSRLSNEVKYSRPKHNPGKLVKNHEYLVKLSSGGGPLALTENPLLDADRSLLTSRTMAKIREDSTAWLRLREKGESVETGGTSEGAQRGKPTRVGVIGLEDFERLEDGEFGYDEWAALQVEGWKND